MHALDDTIVAIASAAGGAARGIVRLSGPALRTALENCFRPEPFQPIAAITRPTAIPGVLWLPGFASAAPADLYLWPGARSYTGQPVAELHTIGSPPLLETIVLAVCAGGARMAAPGEFTLRAFLAGRIDLTQAEAVLGVIDARGEAELKTALMQLAGGLSRPLAALRSNLIDLLAHLEAGFDFADEDLPFIKREELLAQLASAQATVAALVEQVDSRQVGTVQVRVVLLGRPNAGKSSLYNALVGGDGAIVSDRPGTTRDYLTAALRLDGVEFQLIDTAGIETAEPESHRADHLSIAAAAQVATEQEAGQAHVRVVCIDATERDFVWEASLAAAYDPDTTLVVHTKADLLSEEMRRPAEGAILVSTVTGNGLLALCRALSQAVLRAWGPQGDVVAGTAVRCHESLRLAGESLNEAERACRDNLGEELIAAEIRIALEALGTVAGVVYTEDLLDRIFSKFCIGK